MKKLLTLLLLGALWGCKPPLEPSSPFEEAPFEETPVEEPSLPPMMVAGTEFIPEWIGVTAFDAPARVAEGDESYLQWAASVGFTVVRSVVASTYRTYRTPGEGLAQLGPFLDAASKYGLYVEVVVWVDTANYGYHERGLLDFARAVSEITNTRTNVVIDRKSVV